MKQSLALPCFNAQRHSFCSAYCLNARNVSAISLFQRCGFAKERKLKEIETLLLQSQDVKM